MELPRKDYKRMGYFTLILDPKQFNSVFSDLLDNFLKIWDDVKVPQSDKDEIQQIFRNSLLYEKRIN